MTQIIKIDRFNPFSPLCFADEIGKGWIIEEQDGCALALGEIDLAKVHFELMLNLGEIWITGEEKIQRLKKAGHIRLDAQILQFLWENQSFIPEHWKERTNDRPTSIYFDGTILLQVSTNSRHVLCLYWENMKWYMHYGPLELAFHVGLPSAVLSN